MEFRQFNDGGRDDRGGITMGGRDDGGGHHGLDANDQYTDQ